MRHVARANCSLDVSHSSNLSIRMSKTDSDIIKVTAAKAPFCAANGSAALEGFGIDGCMIQRLSVAGSLLAL